MKTTRERKLLLINDAVAQSLITTADEISCGKNAIKPSATLTARGLLLCGLLTVEAMPEGGYSWYEIGRRCGRSQGFKGRYRTKNSLTEIDERQTILDELQRLKDTEIIISDGVKLTTEKMLDYDVDAGKIVIHSNGAERIQACCGGGIYIPADVLTGLNFTERAARAMLWAVRWYKLTAHQGGARRASKSDFYSFTGCRGTRQRELARSDIKRLCGAFTAFSVFKSMLTDTSFYKNTRYFEFTAPKREPKQRKCADSRAKRKKCK